MNKIVLTGLLLLLAGASVLNSLLALAAHPQQAGDLMLNACLFVVLGAVLVLLFGWLMQAARNAGKLQEAQQEYQRQYWQYMQYQQLYGQAAYPSQGQTIRKLPPPEDGFTL